MLVHSLNTFSRTSMVVSPPSVFVQFSFDFTKIVDKEEEVLCSFLNEGTLGTLRQNESAYVTEIGVEEWCTDQSTDCVVPNLRHRVCPALVRTLPLTRPSSVCERIHCCSIVVKT